MFHENTQRMIDYWRAKRGQSLAPARAQIDPSDFPKVLTQTFILGRRGPGDFGFRLSGALLGRLHGMDMRGLGFSSLWRIHDRVAIQTALEAAHRRGEATVFHAEGQAGIAAVGFEILIAPLANADGELGRVLGLYQPTSPLDALRGGAIAHLAMIGASKALAPAGEDFPRVRLAAVGGRLVEDAPMAVALG